MTHPFSRAVSWISAFGLLFVLACTGGNSGDSHYSDLECVNLRFAHCCLATAEAVSLDSETLEHGQVEI